MRNSILVRSIAAVSGIVMLASVAACGDNTTASTDSSAKSDTKTETVSGNFSGAGASSQQAAVEAWIAGFQGTNPDAKVVDASPLDDSAKGDNRVVVKLDHNTTEKGAYPIVLVSYDVACPAYKDANTAKFVKSWLTYVTSDEGQQTAASAAGSAPMSNTLRQKVVKSIDAIKTK